MPKSPQTPSEDGSSTDSDSSATKVNQDSTDSSSDENEEEEEEEEEEEDIKTQFLNDTFKPKPVMAEVSAFAKKYLRGPYLGIPVGKDERKDMRERYYCSPSDFKMFSAPIVFGEMFIFTK